MAILLQRRILQQVLKAKKKRFLNDLWHEIKANVVTFWGKYFCEPCARFSAKKMRISPNFIKNRSRKSREI